MMGRLKPRTSPAAAGVVTLLAGLAIRYGLEGFLSKYGGVAAWAAMVYWCVVFLSPSIRTKNSFIIALAISWAVEFLQLTPGLAWLSSRHILLRLIFGTSFNWPDLIAYAAGVALAAAVRHFLFKSGTHEAPPS